MASREGGGRQGEAGQQSGFEGRREVEVLVSSRSGEQQVVSNGQGQVVD